MNKLRNIRNNLRWEKKFFSNTYNIYSNNRKIGNFKDKMFSQNAFGELNGKKYTYNTAGIFKQRTEIIDNIENKVIGKITYNNWMTKASITINNKTSYWKYDNIWNTKWSITDLEGIKIEYSGSSSKGKIISNTDDELLLLSGLFVTNYYWQITMALLIIVFVPIWSNL